MYSNERTIMVEPGWPGSTREPLPSTLGFGGGSLRGAMVDQWSPTIGFGGGALGGAMVDQWSPTINFGAAPRIIESPAMMAPTMRLEAPTVSQYPATMLGSMADTVFSMFDSVTESPAMLAPTRFLEAPAMRTSLPPAPRTMESLAMRPYAGRGVSAVNCPRDLCAGGTVVRTREISREELHSMGNYQEAPATRMPSARRDFAQSMITSPGIIGGEFPPAVGYGGMPMVQPTIIPPGFIGGEFPGAFSGYGGMPMIQSQIASPGFIGGELSPAIGYGGMPMVQSTIASPGFFGGELSPAIGYGGMPMSAFGEGVTMIG